MKYVLQDRLKDLDESEDVCINGVVHEGILTQNGSAKVRQIIQNREKIDYKCFFWCSTDTEVTTSSELSIKSENEEILFEIVRPPIFIL
jgi:hypothetical protein